MTNKQCDRQCGGCGAGWFERRRAVLKGMLAAVAAWPVFAWHRGLGIGRARADEAAVRRARPEPGDYLVFGTGDRRGETLTLDDLEMDNVTVAWAKDPETEIVRDGSRLNQIVVVRIEPETIVDADGEAAEDGVVAFSAICTHQGCPVTTFQEERRNLLCPCHYSEFDPRDGARVVSGPAIRRLASLPLEVVDGRLVVTAPFTSRVGMG